MNPAPGQWFRVGRTKFPGCEDRDRFLRIVILSFPLFPLSRSLNHIWSDHLSKNARIGTYDISDVDYSIRVLGEIRPETIYILWNSST